MCTERRRRARRKGENGWALASVLWAVTMLSLMAAATQDLTLTSHRTERRAWDAARADAALDAAIVQAVMGINAPTLADRWRVDGVARRVGFSGFTIKVAVQAESGRYDLNAVDIGVLTTLLRTAGVAPDEATTLAGSILNWRSPAGPHALNGANDDDYAAAGLPYRPRHAAFQSVDELRLVLGMTPELFRQIRPALTVYTRRAMIDPAIAPREALLALYDGDADQVDAALKARDEGDDSASPIYSSSHKGVIAPGISLSGQAFDVTAETQVGTRTYRRDVVLEMTSDRTQPYLTLAWRKG